MTWFDFNAIQERSSTCNFCRAKARIKSAEKRAAADAVGGE